MSTTAQVLANRVNAQHSTGPKTKAGKANSSRNTVTHGFYAKSFIVHEDEKADFEEMRGELLAEYDPVDTTAEDFCQQILHATWNLHRLRRIENEIYASTKNPFADENLVRQLDALRRHKGHFERALRSARRSLTEHTTAVFHLSTIPPDIRDNFNPSVDVPAYNRAHVYKWNLYTPEDYVPTSTVLPSRPRQLVDNRGLNSEIRL